MSSVESLIRHRIFVRYSPEAEKTRSALTEVAGTTKRASYVCWRVRVLSPQDTWRLNSLVKVSVLGLFVPWLDLRNSDSSHARLAGAACCVPVLASGSSAVTSSGYNRPWSAFVARVIVAIVGILNSSWVEGEKHEGFSKNLDMDTIWVFLRLK